MHSLISIILICLYFSAICASPTYSMQDMEHIVIFMQENRAFDHYYGTLRGVRGFNDHAAPLLPTGRSPFYQPTSTKPVSKNSMCGCGGCDLVWNTIGDNELQQLFNEMECDRFVGLLASASPSVNFVDGELCSQMLSEVLKTTIQHMKVIYQLSDESSCPADLKANFSLKSNELPGDDNNDNEYMLPFHLAFNETSATCMPAPEMDYPCDLKMWNNGRMDAWNTGRSPGFGMSYFERTDLPYYFALADAFTVGDQYFQSTFTPTNPNRLHQFSGSNGLSANGLVILDDSEPTTGINWETLGETLEKAGVSWKVYQETDNFDDNAFEWFEAFKSAQPGSPLYDKGLVRVPTGTLVDAFYQDVHNKTLPQVSIIIAPTWLSEHATNHPQDGEDLTARLISVLSAPENIEVYSKTAFILNYDEGGQFYDHHWTPTPPVSEFDGKSTVSTVGEVLLNGTEGVLPYNPIGLGFRVPLMIISPWTRGPYTFSEVSDHTSVIKLIEKRFGVTCPNISPWRRTVVSDLLSAFDFEHPDYSWPVFPSTKNNTNESQSQCAGLPYPTIPTKQSFPIQEEGTRLTRPLPYDFSIIDSVKNGILTITMRNIGESGVVFFVYDLKTPVNAPKKYTIEAGKELSDTWVLNGTYDYSLHGPNGFVRGFSGIDNKFEVDILANSDRFKQQFILTAKSQGYSCEYLIKDESGLSSFGQWDSGMAPPGLLIEKALPIHETSYWYDYSIQASCGNTQKKELISMRRFKGHLEVKLITTTDPEMAKSSALKNAKEVHPDVPSKYVIIDHGLLEKTCMKRRSRHKDECWEILNYKKEEL